MVIVLMNEINVNRSLGGTSDPLSVLNERASQIKVDLTWNDVSSGEAHLKTWRAEVKGIFYPSILAS